MSGDGLGLHCLGLRGAARMTFRRISPVGTRVPTPAIQERRQPGSGPSDSTGYGCQFSDGQRNSPLLLLKCKERCIPMEATLSSKGQATIPKAVRERLQIKPGDRFKFFFHPDGVIILPKIPTKHLKGSVPRLRNRSLSGKSIERLRQALRRDFGGRNDRP